MNTNEVWRDFSEPYSKFVRAVCNSRSIRENVFSMLSWCGGLYSLALEELLQIYEGEVPKSQKRAVRDGGCGGRLWQYIVLLTIFHWEARQEQRHNYVRVQSAVSRPFNREASHESSRKIHGERGAARWVQLLLCWRNSPTIGYSSKAKPYTNECKG